MTGPSMLRVNQFLGYFGFQNGDMKTSAKAINALDLDADLEFGSIEGEEGIDTATEFLTAYCYYPFKIENVVYQRDIENMLSDRRTVGLELGVLWYKKSMELRFCGTTTANDRQLLFNYDQTLKKVCTDYKVSEADVVKYFKANVSTMVSEIVDREFNTIGFMIDVPGKTYNAILTRNIDNSYKLTYEGYFSGTKASKELSAPSLDALLAAMAKSPDFNADCLEVLRTKQQIMPGVVFDSWKAILAGKPDCLGMMKEVITNFYLEPTKANYDILIRFSARYIAFNGFNSAFSPIETSFSNSLFALSNRLGKKFSDELAQLNITQVAREPIPAKYYPLFTYAMGNK